jgi:hypothetical protein
MKEQKNEPSKYFTSKHSYSFIEYYPRTSKIQTSASGFMLLLSANQSKSINKFISEQSKAVCPI